MNNFNADRASDTNSYSNACIVILETYGYLFETGWYFSPGREKLAFIKAFFDAKEIAEARWDTRARAKPVLGHFGTGDEHHKAVNRVIVDVIEHANFAGLELDFDIDACNIPRRSERHLFDSERAAESADYTYDALAVLQTDGGYRTGTGWTWGCCTRYSYKKDGVISAWHKDFAHEHIARASWQTNSNHPVPDGFYTGSLHHKAVIRYIEKVIKHAETHNIKLDFSSILPRPPRTIARQEVSA